MQASAAGFWILWKKLIGKTDEEGGFRNLQSKYEIWICNTRFGYRSAAA